MYDWPLDEIRARLDRPVKRGDGEKIRAELASGGLGGSVADFLVPLYEHSDGGTFCDGAFRIIPLQGSKKHRVPGLLGWNDDELKEFGPAGAGNTFYFCMNAFGDLFGVPLGEDREIARDRVGVLWLDRYTYEESSVPWNEIFAKLLADQDNMAGYLGRLKDYEWASGFLGKPDIWHCFSWKLAPALGGDESIDNLQIVSASVHVSFTLQVFKQSVGAPDADE